MMAHPRFLSVAPSSVAGSERMLSAAAFDLLGFLHHRFEARRQELLAARWERQQRVNAGISGCCADGPPTGLASR